MTQRPQFSNIDVWGLTHPGKVRPDNQNHYFTGSLARAVRVDGTSIDEAEQSELHIERLATLAMVADCVGGTAGGEEGARLTVLELVSSVSKTFHQAEHAEAHDPEAFSRLLHDAALSCYETLLRRSKDEGGRRQFSTTPTLFLGVWPHAYLLQVGDSRCYIYQAGALTQISRARRWRRPSTTTVRARGPWQTAAGGPMCCRARWVDSRLSPS